MKPVTVIYSLLSTLLLASGCIPFRAPQSPQGSGRVIDTDTRIPVAQAHIFFRGYPKSETRSDTNGCFSIKATYKTYWLPPLPFDFFGRLGVWVVEAPGYQVFFFDQAAQPAGTVVAGPAFEVGLKRE